MTEGAVFVHGKKYRCRVIDGSGWDRSRNTRRPFFRVHLEVVGGEMQGAKLIREAYFSDKTEEGIIDEFKQAFAINLKQVNLRELDKLILGQECAAQCEIQTDKDRKRETIRAGRLLGASELIPGSIESEVAALLGNTVTPPVNPNEFSDQF